MATDVASDTGDVSVTNLSQSHETITVGLTSPASVPCDWLDLLRNTAVAVAGNLVDGVVLVAFVRSVQTQATQRASRH